MKGVKDTLLFYLGHPAHYHNVSVVLEKLTLKGFNIILVARGKDVLFQLLEELPYHIVYMKERTGGTKWSLISTVLKREWILFKLGIMYRPKMMIGTDIAITHIGKLLGIHSVILNEDDAKEVPLFAKYGMKYASAIFAPNSCDATPYNHKKKGYNGFHELAYLHPNYFTPDKEKVKGLLIGTGRYFILRFAKLSAHHDEGKKGINLAIAQELIKKLSPFGFVYISSERQLEKELEKYRISIHPKEMHHALYYADMYIGDSQTMAAEAAVLGTPSIRFNDFVGKLSYLEELEHKYQLTFGIPTDQPQQLFDKVEELLRDSQLKTTFENRKKVMLENTDDVAQLWFNYFSGEE